MNPSAEVRALVGQQIHAQNELIQALFGLIMSFEPADFVKGAKLMSRGVIIRCWHLIEEYAASDPSDHFSNLRIAEKQEYLISALQATLRHIDEKGDSGDRKAAAGCS